MNDLVKYDFKVVIEFNHDGQTRILFDPPNQIPLELLAGVLSQHLRLAERELMVHVITQRMGQANKMRMELSKMPSLEQIKRTKQ